MGRSRGTRPASYVAVRDGPPPVVLGTVVSCPRDAARDAVRLYGPGARLVAASAAPAELLRRARRADRAGVPVSGLAVTRRGVETLFRRPDLFPEDA